MQGGGRDWARAAREDVVDFAQKVADTVRDPLLVLDRDLRVVFANDAFYEAFKVDREGTEARLVYELGNNQWDIPPLRRLLEEVLPHDDWFEDYRVEHDFEDIGRRVMVLNARRLDHQQLILLAIEDTTERESSGTALRESEEKYRTLFEAMDEGFALCELVRDADGRGVDYRYVELNPALVRHSGISPETLQGRLATEVFPNLDPWLIETYTRVVDEGRSVLVEHYFPHVGQWLRINAFPRGGDHFAVLYSDVSERKRAEQALRDSERRQAFLLRFTDAIRSEPNEQALIERAVQMLAEELAADRAYATRHYPAQDLTKVVHEVRGPELAPLPATLRFSEFPEAGRQTFERTLIFEDTATTKA
jgi:PAS domain S-box-containing protein